MYLIVDYYANDYCSTERLVIDNVINISYAGGNFGFNRYNDEKGINHELFSFFFEPAQINKEITHYVINTYNARIIRIFTTENYDVD